MRIPGMLLAMKKLYREHSGNDCSFLSLCYARRGRKASRWRVTCSSGTGDADADHTNTCGGTDESPFLVRAGPDTSSHLQRAMQGTPLLLTPDRGGEKLAASTVHTGSYLP